MYWKLALASIRHSRFHAALSAMSIAVGLIPVLVAVAFTHPPAVVHSAVPAAEMTLAHPPEGAPFRLLFQRSALAFLIVSAAFTFLSRSAKVGSRQHEMGILRFLGASKVEVIGIVSAEAAVVSLTGAFLALLVTQTVLVCQSMLSGAGSPHPIGLTWSLAAPAMLIGAAISGTTIPAALSIQQDVIAMLEWDR